jgi:hypothetical protein
MKKPQEKKPLLESYNRLFGKMDSFDRLGIKKGKLQESNYFDDSVQFGVKVSLRQAQGMTYVYRDVLRSLGIQEDATDQYIAPDEDSFFDMMYAVIENGVDPKEFVEVVINGKSMSGTKFIQQYGDEFGWDGGESEIDQ